MRIRVIYKARGTSGDLEVDLDTKYTKKLIQFELESALKKRLKNLKIKHIDLVDIGKIIG